MHKRTTSGKPCRRRTSSSAPATARNTTPRARSSVAQLPWCVSAVGGRGEEGGLLDPCAALPTCMPTRPADPHAALTPLARPLPPAPCSRWPWRTQTSTRPTRSSSPPGGCLPAVCKYTTHTPRGWACRGVCVVCVVWRASLRLGRRCTCRPAGGEGQHLCAPHRACAGWGCPSNSPTCLQNGRHACQACLQHARLTAHVAGVRWKHASQAFAVCTPPANMPSGEWHAPPVRTASPLILRLTGPGILQFPAAYISHPCPPSLFLPLYRTETDFRTGDEPWWK